MSWPAGVIGTMGRGEDGLSIAVIGTGISGMSAAWLLSQRHLVTVYEQAARLGGHSNTIDVPTAGGNMPVDMGFIVYNPPNYPNLCALFAHLGVATHKSEMSFAVSLQDGGLEYAGTSLNSVFAQRRNLISPQFWSMLYDLARFYRDGPRDADAAAAQGLSLGDYLVANGYRRPFIRDHLLPMAAAIWSTPIDKVADQPAAGFIRFCDNHGLLRIRNRPEWRTVTGGSREYVKRLTASYADRIRLGCGVASIRRERDCVRVTDRWGDEAGYDHVVIAAHADQALAMLVDASDAERGLLGAISYGANDAVMHRDAALMPHRRNVWASWNYIGTKADGGDALCATYWMNRLQNLPEAAGIFVTLNANRLPSPGATIHRERYEHPCFDLAAMRAQRQLWSLQGERNTWYCGAYFGAGFHEDGLQAGLAVAEALGGVRRPWVVADESGRICLPHSAAAGPELGGGVLSGGVLSSGELSSRALSSRAMAA